MAENVCAFLRVSNWFSALWRYVFENYNLPNDNQSSGTLGDNGETERETTPNLVCNCFITQQTQNTCMTLVQRRPNVFDVGPALYTCYTNILRLQVNCRSPNKITVVIINCLNVHIRHSSNCQFSPHSNLPTLSLVAVCPKSHYKYHNSSMTLCITFKWNYSFCRLTQ